MKVKQLIENLSNETREVKNMEIFIECFGVKVELDPEQFAVMENKDLVISIDDGAFLSSPFTSDNE